jgi:hypothetical protein
MKGPTTMDLLLMAISELDNASRNFREIARASKAAAQMIEQRATALQGVIQHDQQPVEERDGKV